MTKFTPDDGATLHNRLVCENRYSPFISINVDRTQLMLFGDIINTKHGDLRLGVFANVPHVESKPAIMYGAIERTLNHSFIILPDKDSTVKTNLNTADPLDWMYLSLKSSVENINTTFNNWIKQRWVQLHDSIASLEECLDVAKTVGHKVLSAIDLNALLTAHGMASPSDRWPMYRKQANTPYSRLDLVCILAEHALAVDTKDKFKIMAQAGSLITQYGDLELRPAWLDWELRGIEVDYSDKARIL